MFVIFFGVFVAMIFVSAGAFFQSRKVGEIGAGIMCLVGGLVLMCILLVFVAPDEFSGGSPRRFPIWTGTYQVVAMGAVDKGGYICVILIGDAAKPSKDQQPLPTFCLFKKADFHSFNPQGKVLRVYKENIFVPGYPPKTVTVTRMALE